MAIVEVENLSKIYGTGNTQVVALDKISFSVEKGEFVAIIGSSGSGKSTLLHMLGGVDRPTSGQVHIEGNDIYSLNEDSLAIFRRRHIGLIYQFYNLIPVLDVEENITLPQLLDGRKTDEQFLNEIIETLGLTDRRNHLPNQLSGGQQQRVSIGRALINHPAILLADEPTGNLDSKNSKEILDLLMLSNKHYQQTLLLITHDESIALRRREFAMLRSVGMTQDAIAKMLNYESLMYGIKALLWGIPLGLVVCLLLYKAMTSVMSFPFIWPISSILISIVAILAITFLTMAFARKKQQQLNIADTLRHDIV